MSTSEILQAHLPTSKVVKAFNHIYAAALTNDGQPAGAPTPLSQQARVYCSFAPGWCGC
jgi:predicted dinucleotide-binding enzyme